MQLIMTDPDTSPAIKVNIPASIRKGDNADVYSLTNQRMGAGQRRRMNNTLLSNAATEPITAMRILNMVIRIVTAHLYFVSYFSLLMTVTFFLSLRCGNC